MENLDIFMLALLSFLMGAALVGLVVYLRRGASKRSSAGNAPDPDLEEVARLWRSQKNRRMVVQVDEQYYTGASELNPAQQRHLVEVATVLHSWLLEEGQATVTPSTSPVEPVRSVLPQAPTKLEYGPSRPASQEQGVKPVAARPLDALSRVINAGPARETPKFKSIAAQINDILQSRLPGSPFEVQGIILVEMPDQSVIVRVGAEEYAGIEAVPDPAVRAFIKAAVAEWEASTRAGIK
jgi:hypothetical protein